MYKKCRTRRSTISRHKYIQCWNFLRFIRSLPKHSTVILIVCDLFYSRCFVFILIVLTNFDRDISMHIIIPSILFQPKEISRLLTYLVSIFISSISLSYLSERDGNSLTNNDLHALDLKIMGKRLAGFVLFLLNTAPLFPFGFSLCVLCNQFVLLSAFLRCIFCFVFPIGTDRRLSLSQSAMFWFLSYG